MTTDYKETNVSGSSWTRARSLHIENPHDRTPNILIFEEDILVLGERTIVQPSTQLNVAIEDMSEMIPLRNPENGELTGDEVPIAAVYQALYSFYWMKALERDAAMAVSEAAQQEP